MNRRLLLPILVVSMSTAGLPLQCAAWSLWATDSASFEDNFDLNVWKIKQGFLVPDSAGRPTLDFHEENPHNRELVDALEDGTPSIRSPRTRAEIAAEMMKFSDICDVDKMAMNLNLSPPPLPSMPSVDRPAVRKITAMAIVGCMKKLPEQCSYYAGESQDLTMNFGDVVFMRKVKACHDAIVEQSVRAEKVEVSAQAY